ncbi:MarR family transcriptional regulator [Rhodococcus rhodnii LMG 5362]|uniref:MarR family transcriptional regulator n=1 Tax=Rhodococcus rhodnii LMG 5362 TaxID=1273125 RepID=R7WMK7_9NOCA|nr:MarR family transcriptional regulator [Rhodococcus rhodnii LMG 5362]
MTALVSNSHKFARLAGSFAPDGYPRTWLRALGIFEDHGELRVSEFAAHDRCSQPTATTTIRKLIDLGYLTRRIDPEDARAIQVTMTESGREFLHTGRRAVAESITPLFADLEPDQLRRISDGLTEMRRALTAALAPAATGER